MARRTGLCRRGSAFVAAHGSDAKAIETSESMMGVVETFVLRVFVPADAEDVPFCGIVEHPGSGLSESFHGVSELMRVVLQRLEHENPNSLEGIGPTQRSRLPDAGD
jgi:hypothetical protein